MKYITLDKLTVGQYQELYAIQKSNEEDLDKSIASVGIITGQTRWEVEEMQLSEFTRYAREITILFTTPMAQPKVKQYLKVKSGTFKVLLKVHEVSAGQYIDFQHFIKGGLIENLHKIAACIMVPVKKFGPVTFKGKYSGEQHEAVAEQILDLPFVDVHGVCVFFLNLWNGTMQVLENYLSDQLKANPEMSHLNPTDLKIIMDGFTMQNEYPITSELN